MMSSSTLNNGIDTDINDTLYENVQSDSVYVTPENFSNLYSMNDSFSALHINCQSLPKHHNDFNSTFNCKPFTILMF